MKKVLLALIILLGLYSCDVEPVIEKENNNKSVYKILCNKPRIVKNVTANTYKIDGKAVLTNAGNGNEQPQEVVDALRNCEDVN